MTNKELRSLGEEARKVKLSRVLLRRSNKFKKRMRNRRKTMITEEG